jgi:lipid-binding SYLF domain-containing protein
VLIATCLLLLLACSAKKSPRSEVLAASAQILDDVAQNGDNGIPDAVLNRTLCLVVFPSDREQGMASCNESGNDWSKPSLVMFHGKRVPQHDLIILVLGTREVKDLQDGKLQIGGRSPASGGPLAKSTPVITDADLRVGSLLYQRSGKVLTGGTAEGSVGSVQDADKDAEREKNHYDEHTLQSVRSFFTVITPVGIIIHHTAVLPQSSKVPSSKEVDAFHSKEGFDIVCFGREYHIAYHYLILEDGSVKAGRPERCQGAHAKGYNAYLGISVAGDFSSGDNPEGKKGPSVPTDAQLQALVKLCKQLRDRYRIPPHRILRHSDVAATECPGDRFPFVRVLQLVGP